MNSMCTQSVSHLLSSSYVAGDPFEDQVQPLPVAGGVVVEGHPALLGPVGLRSVTINNGRSLTGGGGIRMQHSTWNVTRQLSCIV